MTAVHRQAFRVHSYEVDPYGLLAPRALCAYLQEAAGRHATALGVSMESLGASGLAWVLRRLRVELRRAIVLGERIDVETWPGGTDRVVARREFELWDEAGERVAVASSQWVVVDLAARTVMRLPPAVLALAPAEREAPLVLGRSSLPGGDGFAVEGTVMVRRGDLDVVGHVNNTRYVEWLWEGLPERLWRDCRLAELEIVFLGETRLGERILSRSAPHEGERQARETLRHSLVAHDGRELARALTTWVARGR